MAVNLIKLSVGSESVETLRDWQSNPRAQGPDGLPRHITRMWPKREDEVQSIYWVIQGVIQCRQKVLRFDEVIGADSIRRCAFVLEPTLIRTTPVNRRPFQGWRYLAIEDSPPDLKEGAREDALPSELSAALADLGVI